MSSSTPVSPVRIITCQGSLQLLTALAAVAYHGEQCGNAAGRDYLVIYDVAPTFSTTIERLARALQPWQKVVSVSSAQMADLAAQIGEAGSQQAGLNALRALVGVDSADEIYLVRNWQASNQIMLSAYQSAQKIAYGDGIGYYFGPQRFLPARPRPRPLRDLVNQITGRASAPPPSLASIPFDIGYFLLPDAFQELPPMPVVVPERRYIEAVIERAAAVLEPDLGLRLPTDRPITIFLPGNYAQAGWTSRQHEVQAYADVLQHHADRRSLVLVKPHPRSSARDIQALERMLRASFAAVQLISAPVSHLPVEVLIRASVQQGATITAVGFTTAVIPLAYLFGIPCIVGFGAAILARYFAENQMHINENEQLLQKIINQIEVAATSS